MEKPASHNAFEGEQMIQAARKYRRMVQVGSQSRSIGHKRMAMQMLREGAIGKLYMARGLCFRRRKSIGHTPQEAVPAGLDWDRFLGPAPMRPYSKNRFAYNWHWFWDTGNGDIGNQGVHEMDICRWGLGEYAKPRSVSSSGGKFVWQDDQETPNTQQAHFRFDESEIVFDVRNLSSPNEGGAPLEGSSYTGNIFFGDRGYMVVDPRGFQVLHGRREGADARREAPGGTDLGPGAAHDELRRSGSLEEPLRAQCGYPNRRRGGRAMPSGEHQLPLQAAIAHRTFDRPVRGQRPRE